MKIFQNTPSSDLFFPVQLKKTNKKEEFSLGLDELSVLKMSRNVNRSSLKRCSNKHNRQLPRFDRFYGCIVISYSQDSLLLKSKTRSMLKLYRQQNISALLVLALFHINYFCSVFVPVFLFHTLSFKYALIPDLICAADYRG